MDIEVTFPGGKRVDAHFGNHVVHTDQPVAVGGADTAPAPFDLFLASLATCAGLYVLAFCEARRLATEGLRIVQHVDSDPSTKLPARIRLEITLPPNFPESHRAAVVRAAESCKVKKSLFAPPALEVVAFTSPVENAASP